MTPRSTLLRHARDRPPGAQPSHDAQPSGGTQPPGDAQPSGGTRPSRDAQPSEGTQPPGGAQPSKETQPSEGTQGPLAVAEIIRRSAGYLAGKGVETPRLDGEHILSHVLEMARLDLYLHFDRPLSPGELAACRTLLRRRGAREPLQYVLGSAPFRDLELKVGPGVAVPRPETERLLDVLLETTGRRPGPTPPFASALDVGTGSGAIALALAKEGLAVAVAATDVSPAALAAARSNAAEAGVQVDFGKGALLSPFAGRTFDLIVSNPPYLTSDEWRSAPPEVREWEPRDAMEAGADGLDVIRPLVLAAMPALRPNGWAALEVGRFQTEVVAGIFREAGAAAVEVREDLAGLPRYVFARKAEAARTSATARDAGPACAAQASRDQSPHREESPVG